jgi:predicted N-acetyltransferase YhbS
MPDLLVNLLKLPSRDSSDESFVVRRAQPFELTAVREFIERNFGTPWADEVSVGFAHKPVSVFVATIDRQLVGFAAYECTRRGFFGPTGVVNNARGRGIGKTLLLASLGGLRDKGYVYAIIGGVGPVRFYQKTVGAIVIPDSEPGIYSDLLKS